MPEEKQLELQNDLWVVIISAGRFDELEKPEQEAINERISQLTKRVDKNDDSWAARMLRGNKERGGNA